MNQTLKNTAHPLRKTGGFFLPHLALITLVLGLVIGAFGGWNAHSAYDAHYFQTHYRTPSWSTVDFPKVSKHPLAGAPPGALPGSSSINLSRYPAVGDQGPLGQCAAYATAWDVSYEYRMLHPTSYLRFNPRQMYDHYSDTYNGGQDGGSWVDQDAEIAPNPGLLQFKMLPNPPYVIDNPIPYYDAYGHVLTTDAGKHRLNLGFHPLGTFDFNQGMPLVNAIKTVIAGQYDGHQHPVVLAIGVYPEFDAAAQNGGFVGVHQPGESSRGGHAIVALAYNDNLVFPDGSVGGVLIQNQWTTAWGNQGRAWLSYQMIASDSFGAEYVSINSPASPGTMRTGAGLKRGADGGNTELHKAPNTPSNYPVVKVPPTAPTPRSTSWYVHGVTLTTGQNVSGLLNYYGDKYRVWPVGLAATLGIESGLNPNAERWAGGLDNSCGLSQVIITNVAYYTGIQGARAECNWEENPTNAIYLMSRIYAEYFAYQHNCVTWPYAYGMYNGGGGYSCSYYYNPSGDIAAHVQVFLGWYNYALTHWQGGSTPLPPPTPKKHHQHFPIKRWCRDLTSKNCPSPYFHKHAGTVAREWSLNKRAFHHKGTIDHACGGVKTHEQWNAKRKVMFQSFRHCWVHSWPRFKGDPTKWVKFN